MSTEKVRFNLEVSKVRLSSTISVSPIYRSPGSSGTSVIHSVGSCAKPFNWFTEKLDTAASRCLLNKPTVRWLFPWHAIQPGTVEVYCYGHTKIGTAGTVTLSVCYGSLVPPAFTLCLQNSTNGFQLMIDALRVDLNWQLTLSHSLSLSRVMMVIAGFIR